MMTFPLTDYGIGIGCYRCQKPITYKEAKADWEIHRSILCKNCRTLVNLGIEASLIVNFEDTK